MNPSYLPYPSPQVPQIGLYPMQPPLPAVTASTPSQVIFNIGHSLSQPGASAPPLDPYPSKPVSYDPQPTAYPILPSYAPQPVYLPQQPITFQPVPFYPQPSQPSYHPAPVLPYPSVSEKSYPTPAVSYSLTIDTKYPAQPNHSQPNPGCSYPSLIPHSTSKPKQDSGAGDQSSKNQFQKSHSQDSNKAHQNPTVRPVTPFNPHKDALVLKKAMRGLINIDKKTIINVLTARSNTQRLEIASCYKNIYNKTLLSALESEFTVSGCFLVLMEALLKPLPEFLATEVHRAITARGCNERTLVEILLTASNVEMDAMKAYYRRLYYQSLERDLINDQYGNVGNFERLLAHMVQGRRPESDIVDEKAATQDAQSLVTAGTLRMDIAESSFLSVLSNRSFAHLRRVFKLYEQISCKPLEYAVKSQFSGSMSRGLVAIIQCVEDKAAFFADRIYDATSFSVTKEGVLIRVIVSRCEIDLETIKETYRKRYGKRMELDISNATDGHSKKTLLALIGGYY